MSSVGSHPVDREELMAFLDGQPCGDASAIAAHLESCAECQAAAAEFRGASAKLAAWAVERPSAGLADRVLSAASSGSRRFSLPRKISWSRWTLVVVSAAVVLFALRIFTQPMMMRAPASIDRAVVWDSKEVARHDPELAKKLEESQLANFGKVANGLPGVGRGTSSYGDKTIVRAQLGSVSTGEFGRRGPMIARTAMLRVVVPKFETARASLDAILVRYHAYAATLDVNTTEGSARAVTASLRVPASSLGAAFAELKALGRVENESQAGEEVTEQHTDLVARLKNARETEVRLQDILRTRTGKVKDVLEVEEEISRVRGEIERMEAERTTLEHRVDFATVNLSLVEEYKAKLDSSAPSRGTQLRNSLVTGLRNASDSLFALILFLAEVTPVLLLWLVILSPLGWLGWRRFRAVRAALS